MSRRLVSTLVFAGLVLASCSGATGVYPGDAVVHPELGAPEVDVVVLAADDLVALSADVSANGASVGNGPRGVPMFLWTGDAVTIDVASPGFTPWSYTLEDYPEAGKVEFRLEPVVLEGVVTSEQGRPLPGVSVELGDARDTTDNEGRFALERAVAGTIALSRPAWEPVEYPWDGSIAQYDMTMAARAVRALRASADDILDGGRWETILSLADQSDVDAVIIDLKAEDGTVVYPTEVAMANTIGAVSTYFDARDVVAQAKEHDLYTIARVGVFQDDFYAAANPDNAVLNEDGSLWRSANGFAWLDPSDPAAYEYAISIAEEACGFLGFDEIQFDYVSYPFGGDVSSATFDGAYTQEVRVASIASFLTRAQSVLGPMDCAVSTTILGIVLESNKDEGVGQRVGTMSRIVDVLVPTLYTTNYGAGWKGFEDPNAHAVEIVTTALDGGVGKLEGHGYLRPWLQTWTIPEADQRAVQSAVTEEGMGWQLWSNNANYSADALP